jgi:hypothetical protein
MVVARLKHLTKQQRTVLCVVVGLLLTGWAVKAFRTAHPPAATAAQAPSP